ncbi:MAG: hypothetical protein IPO92_07565 [Saprospiraceae bacterium]|nr:hypothetical protein [Saprospiraceae bacterium]
MRIFFTFFLAISSFFVLGQTSSGTLSLGTSTSTCATGCSSTTAHFVLLAEQMQPVVVLNMH